nr:MAG TPA: hypothetical protein [Crassvirales sp.]
MHHTYVIPVMSLLSHCHNKNSITKSVLKRLQ